MWTPRTEEELVAAVTNGDVSEGPAFDAKREVSKNPDIAKDVAAMANDGGVIIYGIGEDGNGEPTIPNPIPLRGVDEKITAIVRTRLDKPPYIRPYPIPTNADPSVGYFVVVVPQSENAPHMVLGDQENRYYGRSGKSNIILTESEVARLYERRRRWEVDREALLDKTIANAPFAPVPELSYLHLFAKPLLGDEDRLSLAARSEANEVVTLNKLLECAAEPQVYPDPVSPSFGAAYRMRHTDDGYTLVLSGNDTAPPDKRNDDLLTLTVTRGLSTTLFYAGLATELSRLGKTILAVHLADYTTRYFRFVGDLLAKAGFLGAVDCGIAVTNIKGISLAYREQYYMPSMGAVGYPKDVYRRTARNTVSLLQEEPHEAARTLVMPLVVAMSQGNVNLFQMFDKQEPKP